MRWRALLAALCVFALPLAMAGESPSPRQLQVEAAFLVNFVRYTQWPASRFSAAGEPYVVAVVGSEQATTAVRAVAAAAGPIQGRRMLVMRIDPQSLRSAPDLARARLRASHVVFVQDDDDRVGRDVLSAVAAVPVLTVGDGSDFVAHGGMLGLVRDGPRLSFEANPGVIQASPVVVSAKVLKLARLRRTDAS